jgi:hypothetical protein
MYRAIRASGAHIRVRKLGLCPPESAGTAQSKPLRGLWNRCQRTSNNSRLGESAVSKLIRQCLPSKIRPSGRLRRVSNQKAVRLFKQKSRPGGRHSVYFPGWRTSLRLIATSNGGFHEHDGRHFMNTPQWSVHETCWSGSSSRERGSLHSLRARVSTTRSSVAWGNQSTRRARAPEAPPIPGAFEVFGELLAGAIRDGQWLNEPRPEPKLSVHPNHESG